MSRFRKKPYRTRECYKTLFAEVLVDNFMYSYQYTNQQFRHYQMSFSIWHLILLAMSKYFVVELPLNECIYILSDTLHLSLQLYELKH